MASAEAAAVPADELALAQQLWDFHHYTDTELDPATTSADCIMVLGSHDPRVAERGAELLLAGVAPYLIMSGGLGNLTQGVFDRPEADLFADIARAKGVPEERLLVENKSTNTGENVRFTRELLAARGVKAERFVLVQKPYMEKRTYATFAKQWPEADIVTVTSPQLSLAAYPREDIPLRKVIDVMLGDLQRIREYPAKGFQVAMDIPEGVWAAWETLVRRGYTSHLLPGTALDPYRIDAQPS